MTAVIAMSPCGVNVLHFNNIITYVLLLVYPTVLSLLSLLALLHR